MVRKAVHKLTKEEFAVKVIKKSQLDKKEVEKIKMEAEILGRVSPSIHCQCNAVHRSITPTSSGCKGSLRVSLESTFSWSCKHHCCSELLNYPRLSGGELFTRIAHQGAFDEAQAAGIIRSIAEAVNYMHDIGIVHRDLKFDCD